MAVLDHMGAVVEAHNASTAAEIGADRQVVPLDGVRALSLCDDPCPYGVRISPGESLEPVIPWLAGLALIEVEFQKFRDGRGFTTARHLRRHGFRGQLRAVGYLLPDQAPALFECGFSTVSVPEGQSVDRWRRTLSEGDPAAPAPLLKRLAPRYSSGKGEGSP